MSRRLLHAPAHLHGSTGHRAARDLSKDRSDTSLTTHRTRACNPVDRSPTLPLVVRPHSHFMRPSRPPFRGLIMDYEPEPEPEPGHQLQQQLDDEQQPGAGFAIQACSACKKQKRKCDKTLPACSLCQRIGEWMRCEAFWGSTSIISSSRVRASQAFIAVTTLLVLIFDRPSMRLPVGLAAPCSFTGSLCSTTATGVRSGTAPTRRRQPTQSADPVQRPE